MYIYVCIWIYIYIDKITASWSVQMCDMGPAYVTWVWLCNMSYSCESGIHCNTLQHTATHCNTLQHTATHCITLYPRWTTCLIHTNKDYTGIHWNTLQHTVAHLHLLRSFQWNHVRLMSHMHTHEYGTCRIQRRWERGYNPKIHK